MKENDEKAFIVPEVQREGFCFESILGNTKECRDFTVEIKAKLNLIEHLYNQPQRIPVQYLDSNHSEFHLLKSAVENRSAPNFETMPSRLQERVNYTLEIWIEYNLVQQDDYNLLSYQMKLKLLKEIWGIARRLPKRPIDDHKDAQLSNLVVLFEKYFPTIPISSSHKSKFAQAYARALGGDDSSLNKARLKRVINKLTLEKNL